LDPWTLFSNQVGKEQKLVIQWAVVQIMFDHGVKTMLSGL